jgi:hypothetical protein
VSKLPAMLGSHNITNGSIPIEGMVIDYNITNAHLDTLSFNGSAPLIVFNTDFVTVQL